MKSFHGNFRFPVIQDKTLEMLALQNVSLACLLTYINNPKASSILI